MINSKPSSLDAYIYPKRLGLILLSPFAVILLGQLSARTLGPALGVWSWLTLTTGYWVILALIIIWGGGQNAINRWLQPSRGSWLWPLLAISIAVIPTLPMQFPNTWRFLLQTRIWLPTLIFVVINPLAEEGYWRGLLLDAMTNTNKWLAVLYSRLTIIPFSSNMLNCNENSAKYTENFEFPESQEGLQYKCSGKRPVFLRWRDHCNTARNDILSLVG